MNKPLKEIDWTPNSEKGTPLFPGEKPSPRFTMGDPKKIAAQIIEHEKKSGEHTIKAAELLVKARKAFEYEYKGRGLNWEQWCDEFIKLSQSRIRELLQIGRADDPAEELEELRAKTRARVQKHREKKNGEAPLRNGGDDESVSPGDTQPAKLNQTRLAEIGTQLVNEANDLTTFDKIDATPQHAGIAVLLAVIDSDGRTFVKQYLDDKSVLQAALAAVGKSKNIAEVEQEASDLSADKMEVRKKAVASGLKRSPNIDKAHQTPQAVSQ
jgi:hypothetical protein